MKITLDFRNPTPSHCDVAVFVNGALTGVLTLRQDELITFQHIVMHGLDWQRDEFLGTGDPGTLDFLRMPFFQCPRCSARSYHLKDIEEGYCGASCHDWTRQ